MSLVIYEYTFLDPTRAFSVETLTLYSTLHGDICTIPCLSALKTNNRRREPGVLAHAINVSTREADTGRPL